MEDESEFIIDATNEIYDNVWLGDLTSAQNSATTSLERLKKKPEISEWESAAAKMKTILREARSEARKKEVVKNKRLWVFERVCEEVRKIKLDSTKVILGFLWIHLQSLAEGVNFLVKAETQRTLNDLGDWNMPEKQLVRKGNRYRFSTDRLSDRYEIRAVVDASLDKWDLGKLKSNLPGFLIEEISRKTSSDFLELYSSDMHLQVLRQGKIVRMIIHAPKKAETETRIDNVVETIMSSLIL